MHFSSRANVFQEFIFTIPFWSLKAFPEILNFHRSHGIINNFLNEGCGHRHFILITEILLFFFYKQHVFLIKNYFMETQLHITTFNVYIYSLSLSLSPPVYVLMNLYVSCHTFKYQWTSFSFSFYRVRPKIKLRLSGWATSKSNFAFQRDQVNSS